MEKDNGSPETTHYKCPKVLTMETIEMRDKVHTPIYVETRVLGKKPRLFVVIL